MNRAVVFFAVLMVGFTLSCQAAARAVDPLHIAGIYECKGYDSQDGAFAGDLTFTLDEAGSNFSANFGAYRFAFKTADASASYSGFAAAQGQSLAMYFANDSQQAVNDRGVGMAFMSNDQDEKGNYRATLHKSYYLPEYSVKDGRAIAGRGTEVCVKKSGDK